MSHISNPFDSPDDALAHYGVLGMKWGVRKDESKERSKRAGGTDEGGSSKRSSTPKTDTSSKKSPSKSSATAAPKKLSRRERRAEERAFYDKKAEKLFEIAVKDPESLILVDTGRERILASGREFAEHMMAGGLMNVKTSDVFATKDPTGKFYVEGQGRIGNYQKDK